MNARRSFQVEYASGVAEAERGIETKAIQVYQARPLSLTNPDGWYPEGRIVAGERVSAETVIGLSAAWACVNFWAGNIAALPLMVYRTVDGVDVPHTAHPLYSLLHGSPDADWSAFDFWERIQAGIEIYGNGFAKINRNGTRITSFRPLRPETVSVRRLRTGELEYAWSDDFGAHRELQRDMLHVRGPMGDEFGGRSTIAANKETFGTALAIEAAAGSIFGNGARPSGTLSTEKALVGEQRPLLEKLLQEKFVGAVNAGRPMLLDNGLKWEQISIDPVDAQMLESRKFSILQICSTFEVDPHLVGYVEGNSSLGSSITDQTLSLMKFKMRKRLKRLESAMEMQLLTPIDRANGVSISFNVEAFLRADSLGRAQFYDIMKQFMTKNEIRAQEGLPPVEGGDTMMAQMQDVPLADAIRGGARNGQN